MRLLGRFKCFIEPKNLEKGLALSECCFKYWLLSLLLLLLLNPQWPLPSYYLRLSDEETEASGCQNAFPGSHNKSGLESSSPNPGACTVSSVVRGRYYCLGGFEQIVHEFAFLQSVAWLPLKRLNLAAERLEVGVQRGIVLDTVHRQSSHPVLCSQQLILFRRRKVQLQVRIQADHWPYHFLLPVIRLAVSLWRSSFWSMSWGSSMFGKFSSRVNSW